MGPIPFKVKHLHKILMYSAMLCGKVRVLFDGHGRIPVSIIISFLLVVVVTNPTSFSWELGWNDDDGDGYGGDLLGNNDDDDDGGFISLFRQDYSPPAPPPPPPHPPSASCEDDLGGVGTLDTTCKVVASLNLTRNVYIAGKGNFYILPNVTVNCSVVPRGGGGSGGRIYIKAYKM